MINKLIQLIRRILGFGVTVKPKDQIELCKAKRTDLLKKRTQQENDLNLLEQKITDIQSVILATETKWKQSTGKIREITEHKLAQMLRDNKRLDGLQEIIFRNIEVITSMIAKNDEMIQILTAKMDGSDADELNDKLRSLLDDMREEDMAIIDLTADTTYVSPLSPSMDVAAELTAYHKDNPAPVENSRHEERRIAEKPTASRREMESMEE